MLISGVKGLNQYCEILVTFDYLVSVEIIIA